MKGGIFRKLKLRVSIFVPLLALVQLSLAFDLPSDQQLQALQDLAYTNANGSMSDGGALESWRFEWAPNGSWIGSNPCVAYRGLRCWSNGNVKKLIAPPSSLKGPIAPAFGNLTSLRVLDVSENQLFGDIESVLANLTGMTDLSLQGNKFTGSLSSWLPRMPQLQELNLARNSLGGFISTGVFTNFTDLTAADISNNSFSGPIPDDLVSLPSLLMLLLGGNNFNGSVPTTLSNSTLSIVDLSGNSLQGNLSTDWNMPNLRYLDLSRNNLSGFIPQQLLNLNVSTFTLNLAQNNFVGNISANLSSKFGCNAFVGNPGLILEDSKCSEIETAVLDPPVPARPSNEMKSSKGLSVLAIAVLAVGDVALLLISVVGFVLFCAWWRKKKIYNDDDGDTEPYVAWATASKGDNPWPVASKGDLPSKDTSFSGAIAGPLLTTEARSSFARRPEVKPALKSLVGTIADPAMHHMTADVSNDYGANIVILDTTLTLEFGDLLRAKALVLGEGGHGIVYMACLDDGEMLAIKRIEELALADERNFSKQCEQLAEVLHPNLLQLRAYCWSCEEKLLVSDYMPNGSVHSRLHERTTFTEEASMDWATRLKIAVGTARAVAHLHDSDLMHGNLKATNVLLDAQFEPRVSDFGLEALLQKPLQRLSAGSDGYLAPELCASASPRRTQDGDVYSLGVFLLELLTGKKPVENGADLPAWVQEMTLANRTVQLFDPALTATHVLPAQDVIEFLELAQACVSTDAAARPSTTIVLRTLESIVPGSTAPRSYVKDDNIDSDVSLRETADTRIPPAFDIPVHGADDYDEDANGDGDDGGLSSKDAMNLDDGGFLQPLHLPTTSQERSAGACGIVGGPFPASGDTCSNVSTPQTSPSASRKVDHSPFVSIPLQ